LLGHNIASCDCGVHLFLGLVALREQPHSGGQYTLPIIRHNLRGRISSKIFSNPGSAIFSSRKGENFGERNRRQRVDTPPYLPSRARLAAGARQCRAQESERASKRPRHGRGRTDGSNGVARARILLDGWHPERTLT
jgi:hypothetical protein